MKNQGEAPRAALVTGGTGFIGSHLTEALVRRGFRVTVVDDLSNSSLQNIQAVKNEVEFHTLDILSAEFHHLLCERTFDVVFHLAANAYVPPSVKDPAYDFRLNLFGPFHLFETLRQRDHRPIVIAASSAAVYGNPARIPICETDPTFPISPYGVSKLATERYLAVYSHVYGFRAAEMRFFSVYGPRQYKQIVFDFIRKLTHNPAEMEILGDGTQMRDLVFVEDVVRALLTVLDRAPLEGEVYNVASGKGYTTTDIAQATSRVMGLTPCFQYTGSIRAGDAEKWIANIDRLSALGYVPEFSLDEGIERTVAWFRMLESLPG